MSRPSARQRSPLGAPAPAAILLAFLLFWPAAVQAQNNASQDQVARYTVTFTSTWSAETHPGFPSGAHYSPLIGATHNLSVTLWMSGTLASPGIEQMAETGATTTLRGEITALGAGVRETIAGPGMATSPGTVTIQSFSASRDHPLVTLVTMIAPSPDWFVGVHDLPLLDDQGQWRDQVSVVLYPYDAGADDGVDYTSANLEPAQHQPIHGLRGQTPFSDAPMGEFVFTRQHHTCLPLAVK